MYGWVLEALWNHHVATVEFENDKPVLASDLLVYETNSDLSAFGVEFVKRKFNVESLLAHQVVELFLVGVVVDEELLLGIQVEVYYLP